MDENNNSVEPQYAGSTVDESSDAVQMLQAAMNGEPEAPVEAQPEPEQSKAEETPAQEEKFAAKFAALSRKEKALRQRETQLNQQMQQIEQRLKQMEEQSKQVESYKQIPDRLRKEPLKVLEESGLKFEQLAEMVLNDGKPTQDMVLNEYEKKVMSRMEELEKKLAEKEAKEEQAKYDQAISQFQGQLSDFITQTADYELIRANDSADLVFNVIEEHFNETGEILSNKEACDAVEEYLLEEAKKLVDREKVKKLLQPQTPQKSAAPTGKSSPTLSNAQAAQASSKQAAKVLSDEESKAQAAKLIRWDDQANKSGWFNNDKLQNRCSAWCWATTN